MSKHVLTVAVATALVLCGGAAGSIGARQTAANVPSRLVGAWGKTMTATTWRKHRVYDEPAGHWEIRISANGAVGLVMPPARPTDSAFTTMPIASRGVAEVRLGGTADGFCAGGVRYAWKMSARQLTFKSLNRDLCSPRKVLLTSGAFTRR